MIMAGAAIGLGESGSARRRGLLILERRGWTLTGLECCSRLTAWNYVPTWSAKGAAMTTPVTIVGEAVEFLTGAGKS